MTYSNHDFAILLTWQMLALLLILYTPLAVSSGNQRLRRSQLYLHAGPAKGPTKEQQAEKARVKAQTKEIYERHGFRVWQNKLQDVVDFEDPSPPASTEPNPPVLSPRLSYNDVLPPQRCLMPGVKITCLKPMDIDLNSRSLDELHRKRNFLQNALLPHIPGRTVDQTDGEWMPREAVIFPRLSISAKAPHPFALIHSSTHFLSGMDARNQRGILGTAGGDLGELLVALHAWERVRSRPSYHATGQSVSRPVEWADVMTFFQKYLRSHLGLKRRFYFHSDAAAMAKWGDETGVPDPQHPRDSDERARLVAFSARPENVGSGHFRRMLNAPEEFHVRLELVEYVIQVFFTIFFDRSHPDSRRLIFEVLEGPRNEADSVLFVNEIDNPSAEHHTATLRVGQSSSDCAPLVTPWVRGFKGAVVHETVVYNRRQRMAAWVATEFKSELQGTFAPGADPGRMLATAMQSIGTNYLRRSLGLENEKHGQKEYFQVQYWTNHTLDMLESYISSNQSNPLD